jgi:hypothetical protein
MNLRPAHCGRHHNMNKVVKFLIRSHSGPNNFQNTSTKLYAQYTHALDARIVGITVEAVNES